MGIIGNAQDLLTIVGCQQLLAFLGHEELEGRRLHRRIHIPTRHRAIQTGCNQARSIHLILPIRQENVHRLLVVTLDRLFMVFVFVCVP